jgi:4'-phosphopantetheinyl transferase EntD
VGSISHTKGYCGAVAANQSAFPSVGLDIEIVGRVTSDLFPLVLTTREATFLSAMNAPERARAATIIFSAKEAFYKCQYPVTKRWLDFHDASLELITADLVSGTFIVDIEPHKLGLGRVRFPLIGRFRIDNEFALTGIALEDDTVLS